MTSSSQPVEPWAESATRRLATNKAKIADIDAELNGGALVEVGRIAGLPLYIRVDHHDPERAKYDIELVTEILKGAFLDPVGYEADTEVTDLVSTDANPKYYLANPPK